MPLTAQEAIATTTNNWIHTKMVDNIHVGNPLTEDLQKNNRISAGSGRNIEVPITYKKSETFNDSFNANTDKLTTDKGELFDYALYPWARVVDNVIWSIDDIQTNSGPQQQVDYLMSKFDATEMSIKNGIEKVLMESGGTKKPNGLVNLVGTRAGTIGNIDASDGKETWWRPKITPITGLTLANDNFKYANLAKAIRAVTYGKAFMPTLLFTRDKFFGQIEAALQPQQRWVNSAETPDQGFDTFLFRGIPVCYPDEDLAAEAALSEEDIYILNNMQGLELVYDESQWLDATQPRDIEGALRWEVIINCRFNLVSSNRRLNGVLRHST